jgi:hypothetical protein
MRLIKAVSGVLACAAVSMGASQAFAQGAGCTALNGATFPVPAGPFSLGTLPFDAGDTISLTNTAFPGAPGGAITLTLTSPVSLVSTEGATVTGQVPATGTFPFSGTAAGAPGSGSLVTATCVAGALPGGGGSSGTPIAQTVNNAETAIRNGQMALRSFSDSIGRAVQDTFGFTGALPARTAEQRPTAPSPQVAMRNLLADEQALVDKLADQPDSADVQRQLADVRRNLNFARATAALSAAPADRAARTSNPTSAADGDHASEARLIRERMARGDTQGLAQRETAVHDGPIGGRPPGTTSGMAGASPSFSLKARDLVDACEAADGCNTPADMMGRRWNVWLEGRAVGANDSLANNNALGFVGSTGVDYKFTPWIAAGLSVGVESFETRFGGFGVRSGTVGVSAMPYVGIRIDDNIFASLFVGVTALTYNANPAAGVSARFESFRLFGGGSLSGVWRDGAWRIQPTLSAVYGGEQQYGYTDSAGTAVGGQNVDYGRVSAGPEVGYTFWADDRSWSVEPFVLAKFNLDFASSNVFNVNGIAVSLRPGTQASGTAGAGVTLQSESGFYLRMQGSYDSIGVSGFDSWTALARGGFRF